MGEGHVRAMNRLSSYLFKSGVIKEQMGGVDFYRFLCELIDHFDERFEELQKRLADVRDRIFTKDGMAASFTGSTADLERFWEIAGDFGLSGQTAPGDGLRCRFSFGDHVPEPKAKQEAFIVPGDVCYVAKGADVHETVAYDGAWAVLSNALSFDYLWNEVRVKGGAYGVGFRIGPDRFGRFYSFRDPGVDATIARYDEAGAWLARFAPAEDEMEGYVVSTVASHDAPVKPRQTARRQDVALFSGKPEDYRERLREEKLAATPEKLRAYAEVLDRIAADGAACAFGGESVLRASKRPWEFVELL